MTSDVLDVTPDQSLAVAFLFKPGDLGRFSGCELVVDDVMYNVATCRAVEGFLLKLFRLAVRSTRLGALDVMPADESVQVVVPAF
jgi:hypothetical protein